ncbi:SusC/RagA family TonB-linked outer membrane protein [Ornithobacterium rhinotracheale]|uniref:SusC/RagA family TonB-linked outer membrane protein n=1 Tax=Ornithobacterium rhinotracheale TaxID=28251 RepID=UPI004036AC5E
MKKNVRKLLSVGVFCLSLYAFGQEKPITGRVVDGNGYPVQDAYVYVEGSDKGVYTDENGNYKIEAQKGDTLGFEFIGLDTKTIKIGSASKYDVKLSSGGSVALDAVTQMGYRQLSKNDQTGSVVQIKSEDLDKVPLASVDQALQGKVAGLNITGSSGTPGSAQYIRIRGVNSINAGKNPLFVIDGVPVEDQNPDPNNSSSSTSSISPLSLINNSDVESVTVLKDASATAPYGARGANGVILITTKSGKAGKAKFSFSSRFGFQRLATPSVPMLSAEQRYKLFTDALDIWNVSAQDREKLTNRYYGQWLKDGRPNSDWGKAIERDAATIQDYTLSATGGGKDSNFFASLGYNKTQGVIIGSDFTRITGRLNYNRNLTDKLEFSTNNSVSDAIQNAISEQGGYFTNPMLIKFFARPTARIYTKDGEYNKNIGGPFYNPLYVAEKDIKKRELVRILSTNSLKYNFSKNISLKSLASFDYTVNSNNIYFDPSYGEGAKENGYVSNTMSKDFVYVFQNNLTYKKAFGEHNVEASIVQEFQKYKSFGLSGEGTNIPEPGRIYLNTTSSSPSVWSNFKDRATASYTALLNYSYAKRYVLDLTLRREGDSRFAKGHQYGTFYSVGGAWNLHNEEFLKSSDAVNLLKLRASYGQVGNSDIGYNLFLNSLRIDKSYDSKAAAIPAYYGNDKLTWETTNNFDAGIDFGFFNNKISGQITYFDKETTDMLSRRYLPYTSGYREIWVNNGRVSNKGIELEFNANIVNTDDFKLNINLNGTLLKNRVEELSKDANGNPLKSLGNTSLIDEGHAIYEFYLPVWAGVNRETGAPQWYVNPSKSNDITEKYAEAEQVPTGKSPIATRMAGLGLNLKVKNFFASANFFYSGGNQIYEDWVGYTLQNGLNTVALYNGQESLINSWTPNNKDTDYPKIYLDNNGAFAVQPSTRRLYDGDYIRLRNVQIGYDLPSEWAQQIGLQGVKFNVTGVNLWTWVKDKNLKFDPEVRPDGWTNLTSPPIKSVTFGVNINF